MKFYSKPKIFFQSDLHGNEHHSFLGTVQWQYIGIFQKMWNLVNIGSDILDRHVIYLEMCFDISVDQDHFRSLEHFILILIFELRCDQIASQNELITFILRNETKRNLKKIR